jgi:hypothetical protein
MEGKAGAEDINKVRALAQNALVACMQRMLQVSINRRATRSK